MYPAISENLPLLHRARLVKVDFGVVFVFNVEELGGVGPVECRLESRLEGVSSWKGKHNSKRIFTLFKWAPLSCAIAQNADIMDRRELVCLLKRGLDSGRIIPGHGVRSHILKILQPKTNSVRLNNRFVTIDASPDEAPGVLRWRYGQELSIHNNGSVWSEASPYCELRCEWPPP